MKYKSKTVGIKRARQEKANRMYYFGYFLPLVEGFIPAKNNPNN